MKKVRWYLIYNEKVLKRYDDFKTMYKYYHQILKSLDVSDIGLLTFEPEIYEVKES